MNQKQYTLSEYQSIVEHLLYIFENTTYDTWTEREQAYKTMRNRLDYIAEHIC